MVHPPSDARRNPHKIYEVVITQIGPRDELPIRDYDYNIYEHNTFIPEGQAGRVLRVGRGVIKEHTRGDRALELVRRALEDHCLKA